MEAVEAADVREEMSGESDTTQSNPHIHSPVEDLHQAEAAAAICTVSGPWRENPTGMIYAIVFLLYLEVRCHKDACFQCTPRVVQLDYDVQFRKQVPPVRPRLCLIIINNGGAERERWRECVQPGPRPVPMPSPRGSFNNA